MMTTPTGQQPTATGYASDIDAVIQRLGTGPVDLLGCSLGGIASLRCAIRHPESVRRLVVVSAPFRRAAWFPEILAGFDQMSASTRSGRARCTSSGRRSRPTRRRSRR
jgi:pimeloyl-ACP methyl ester carboxylesterase